MLNIYLFDINRNYAITFLPFQQKFVEIQIVANSKIVKIWESIKIPNSVTVIGNKAFEDCYKLESIDIPEGITGLGLKNKCN
jgi:hypothetical protein